MLGPKSIIRRLNMKSSALRVTTLCLLGIAVFCPHALAPLMGPSLVPIDVWYGDNQKFGINGEPQEWVNILGNVSSSVGVASLTYRLNGGPVQELAVAPKSSPVPSPRLAIAGDFNAEFDYASLREGRNTLLLTARDEGGNRSRRRVNIDYVAGQVWPLNYSVNWTKVPNVQSAVEVVDGKWQIQPDGTLRTMEVGYDRLISLGDMNGWKNYVAEAEITPNVMGTGDAYGFGIIAGWRGHTTLQYGRPLPDQPRTGHPFCGDGYYGTVSTPRLAIGTNDPPVNEAVLADADSTGLTLKPGVEYVFEFEVQPRALVVGSTLSLKVWPAGTTEPANWNLQANGPLNQGSALIDAHDSDVSVGAITVTPLP